MHFLAPAALHSYLAQALMKNYVYSPLFKTVAVFTLLNVFYFRTAFISKTYMKNKILFKMICLFSVLTGNLFGRYVCVHCDFLIPYNSTAPAPTVAPQALSYNGLWPLSILINQDVESSCVFK